MSHGLGELPAKVDVQIKIVRNGVDYIFTGTGTAHRDNDQSPDFGGIVYLYNAFYVKLFPPAEGYSATKKPGLAYTGICT